MNNTGSNTLLSQNCYAEIWFKPIQEIFSFFDHFTTMMQSTEVLHGTLQNVKKKTQNAEFLGGILFSRHKHGFVFPSYTLHRTQEFYLGNLYSLV